MNGNSIMSAAASFGGMFSLQWVVDESGYELRTKTVTRASAVLLGLGDSSATCGIIQARGGKLRPYIPATRGPLHHEFAKVRTPEDALTFVSAYGFLFTSSEEGAPFSIGSTGDADYVDSVLELAKSVRYMLRLVDMYRDARPMLFPLLDAKLAPRLTVKLDFERDLHGNPKHQRPILRVMPFNLAGFILLQVAEEAAGSRWVACEQCRTPFLVGKGGRGRSHKVFCSDACKSAASRAARAEAAPIEKRKCPQCGTAFEVPSNSRRVYCHDNCKVNWNRQQKRRQSEAPAARTKPKPKPKARAKK